MLRNKDDGQEIPWNQSPRVWPDKLLNRAPQQILAYFLKVLAKLFVNEVSVTRFSCCSSQRKIIPNSFIFNPLDEVCPNFYESNAGAPMEAWYCQTTE